MDPEQHARVPRPRIPSPGQLVTLILIMVAIVLWVIIILMGFQLQERIDQNFRLIMELAESAGAS